VPFALWYLQNHTHLATILWIELNMWSARNITYNLHLTNITTFYLLKFQISSVIIWALPENQ
jgi:hypothetical protein